MNRYYIEIVLQAGSEVSERDLRTMFDPIADAVYELTDVIDADLGANLAERTLEFMMSVDADNEIDALAKAVAATRTAIEATADHFEAIQQTVRKEQLQLA